MKPEEQAYTSLKAVRFFLLDMDGTIFLSDRLLPGAARFLDLLRTHDIEYLFLTNNSSSHRGRYAEKLQRLGLDVRPEQIFTSGEATARYLHRRKPGARVYLVGTPALEEEFALHGFELVEEQPDFAVLGFDTTLTYRKLRLLCDFVRAGLPYIATHPDINCPTEEGFIPDIGAVIAFVETSTGRRPDVIVGKPFPPLVEALVARTGLPTEAMCMIGDRLYTDIALGRAGLQTVLVLTGETKREALAAAPHQPDYVMENLVEFTAVLERLLSS